MGLKCMHKIMVNDALMYDIIYGKIIQLRKIAHKKEKWKSHDKVVLSRTGKIKFGVNELCGIQNGNKNSVYFLGKRVYIRVTDIKKTKMTDITEEDAKNEGYGSVDYFLNHYIENYHINTPTIDFGNVQLNNNPDVYVIKIEKVLL